MNAYEEKQERKRERYEELADKARGESQRAYEGVRRIADCIPMGQPILIGHHSEKAHRRDIARMDSGMRRSVEASNKAAYYEEKAASVGTGGISSDDPEALAKLTAKVEKLEELQKRMVAVNKLVRKNDAAGIVALGYSEYEAAIFFQGDFLGRKGYPAYELSNNRANIKRIRERIKQIEARVARPTQSIEVGGVKITDNTDANRIQIFFDGKPSDEVRSYLKRFGFRWSPSVGAWQSYRSSRAIYAAKEAAKMAAAEE